MEILSERRQYILNRLEAYKLITNDHETKRSIEIILSFKPTDEEIERGLTKISRAFYNHSVNSLPGYTHKIFKQYSEESKLKGN